MMAYTQRTATQWCSKAKSTHYDMIYWAANRHPDRGQDMSNVTRIEKRKVLDKLTCRDSKNLKHKFKVTNEEKSYEGRRWPHTVAQGMISQRKWYFTRHLQLEDGFWEKQKQMAPIRRGWGQRAKERALFDRLWRQVETSRLHWT